jgi:hypothetical protein
LKEENKMLKNSYGYVIVRWEVDPAENVNDVPQVTFTVLDAGKGKTEKTAGTLKVYGKKFPRKPLRILARWSRMRNIINAMKLLRSKTDNKKLICSKHVAPVLG